MVLWVTFYYVFPCPVPAFGVFVVVAAYVHLLVGVSLDFPAHGLW